MRPMSLARICGAWSHLLVGVPRKQAEDLSSPFAISVHFHFSGPGDSVFLQSWVNIGGDVAGDKM